MVCRTEQANFRYTNYISKQKHARFNIYFPVKVGNNMYTGGAFLSILRSSSTVHGDFETQIPDIWFNERKSGIFLVNI